MRRFLLQTLPPDDIFLKERLNFRQIYLNGKFIQLRRIDGRWRVDHHIASGVILREGDEVADGFLSAQDRHQTVESERQSAVRWCAELERVHQEAKLVTRFLVGKT